MKTETNELEQLLSLKKVAELLGISVRAVYRLIDAGELPQPLKVGRSARLRASDYRAYVSKLTKGGNAA